MTETLTTILILTTLIIIGFKTDIQRKYQDGLLNHEHVQAVF